MAFPADISPMLATLVDGPPAGEDWLYEIKWDGYRAISYVKGRTVVIRSRNNKDFTEKYSPITKVLKGLTDCIVDGEIVVLNEQGLPDFNAMQNWKSEADGELVYYVFDLLWANGKSTMGLPLTERRKLLWAKVKYLEKNGAVRFSQHFLDKPQDLLAIAQKMDLEGIMAKRADSLYTPGIRTKEWLKVKVEKVQEGIICGYTKNEGTSKSFSSLVLGVMEKGELSFIGVVGTGFSDKLQLDLLKQFKPYVRKTCPFKVVPDLGKRTRFSPARVQEVVWLKPHLVCEVSYREFTPDGIVRHPSFQRMRDDKRPIDVVREVPKHVK